MDNSVTLRFAFPDDDQAVRALAALDCAPLPSPPVLLAEVGGAPRAALSLADGRAIADPFHHSGWVITLLRARAAQLTGTGVARRSGRIRRIAARIAARAGLRLAGRRV